MIVGLLLIVGGVAVVAADRPISNRLVRYPGAVLLVELIAFLWIFGGILALTAAV